MPALRERTRVLGTLLSVLLIVGVIPGQAGANNFATPIANDRFHYFYYDGLTTAWSSATSWSRTNNLGPTRINPGGTSSHGSADVHTMDANYGNTGWTGQASCQQTISYGFFCVHWHVRYNLHYGSTDSAKKGIACMELGHTVGLEHDYTRNTCMKSRAYVDYSDHDRQHINSTY